jgi:hypothetical protein
MFRLLVLTLLGLVALIGPACLHFPMTRRWSVAGAQARNRLRLQVRLFIWTAVVILVSLCFITLSAAWYWYVFLCGPVVHLVQLIRRFGWRTLNADGK